MDGTLLTSDKRLSKRNVQAVQRAAAQGTRVVLATARPPRTVREIYGHLGLDTPQINYNGALLQLPGQPEPIDHRPLPADLAFAICTVARKLDRKCVITLEVLDRWITDHHDPSLATETSRMFQPDVVGPLYGPLKKPVTKLLLLAPGQRMVPMREHIAQRYAESVTIVATEDHCTQITRHGVDKGDALRRVAEHLGIGPGNTLAIGDAVNDLPMLRWAGTAVAVGNAWPQVKAAADHVVASNDADGVCEMLEKHVIR